MATTMPETVECRLCGAEFNAREDLAEHNVARHGMSREASRRRVERAYGG